MLLPAALLLHLVLAEPGIGPSELRTGDLVLHTSRSAQSTAIAVATHSPYTHVGVVVQQAGQWWVVEASRRAQKTKLAAFVARGRTPTWVVRDPRLDDETVRDQVARAALSLLGTPYDPAFSEGTEALYCSELVVVAWAKAGLAIGEVEPVGSLDLEAPVVRALFAKRWRRHPACRGVADAGTCRDIVAQELVVTPAGLARDTTLRPLGRLYVE